MLIHPQVHEWLVSRFAAMRALSNLPKLPALIVKSKDVAVEALTWLRRNPYQQQRTPLQLLHNSVRQLDAAISDQTLRGLHLDHTP